MKIQFHGAAREVGRSCISITTKNGNRYLLDVGIKFQEDGFSGPEGVTNVPGIKGVFLSHAHLDHSGGLPLFEHQKLKCPIFCTRQTFAITKILLKDSYKIARIKHTHPAYDKTDLVEVSKETEYVQYDKWYVHNDLKFKYLNAGHIPGSAMILIEADGKRILYTGDYNNKETELMYSAIVNKELTDKPIDVLITESTYGNRELPDRKLLNKQFIASVKKTISGGGSVLIPVFALGRAQETLIMLGKENLNCKIYLDGMAKTITKQIISTSSKYVKNKDLLSEIFFNKIEWISSPKRRNDAIRNGGIFITTSGMLQGGPVLEYLKELWHNPKNKLTLMGFQCKRTNGRHLVEEGFVYIDGWKTQVKCAVEKYDFSGHTDSEFIKKMVSTINPKMVFFQHGDEESVDILNQWAKKNIKGKTYAPSLGEIFEI
ncbi:hypothetical protein COV13_02180 [Candidatus Woesearchaeota archaeon CG10_big_fil_rev_8_21_14_0_10_32_9]|nr:MAG: hypothetical protein COV13_02180 [Candidatus Woesearchaeota archaeon CG10_big_fil_rev_8_21_14_0_10_32_9]